MKKSITLVLIAVLALASIYFGYQSYRAGVDRDMAARAIAAEQAAALERDADVRRKGKAEAEAHRLAALKAEQDAEAATVELARLRAAQANAEAARLAAETAAREAAATRERLTREKEQAVGEARRLAELREKEASDAQRVRDEALRKLADVERLSRERADREAARMASLKQQQELELEAERSLLTRGILPADYKRRQHYYQMIEMQNAGISAENANLNPKAVPATRPNP